MLWLGRSYSQKKASGQLKPLRMAVVAKGVLAQHKPNCAAQLIPGHFQRENGHVKGEYLDIILQRDNRAKLRFADASRSEQHEVHTQLLAHAFRHQVAKLCLHVAMRMRVRTGEAGENTAVLLVGHILVLGDGLF